MSWIDKRQRRQFSSTLRPVRVSTKFYNTSLVQCSCKTSEMSRSSNLSIDKIPEVDLVKVKEIENAGPYKPKKKRPGFRRNLNEYLAEYSNNTGIHGFKYIMGERDRSLFERMCWLIAFSVSLYICIGLIQETWNKWETSPVLVSFARSPTPVWQVPFPAVTICSETKARQRIYNYTHAFDTLKFHPENMTKEDMLKLSKISLICDNHLYNEGNLTTGFDSIEYLMSIAPQFDEMFYSCKWTLINETCDRLFAPLLTEEGLCYTFNMLDRSELLRNKVHLHGDYMSHGHQANGWTLETGYPKTAGKDAFPRRAMSAGSSAGLFLLMRAYEQDLDYICRGPVQGFKVLLHHPAEIPRVGTQYFRVPLNQEVVVAIKPDMMTTSEGLRAYDPHRRQCFFPTERFLTFYQSYTQQNCQVECLTNFTLEKCGCVAYHMPHEETTPICGSGSLQCMFDAQTELLEQEVEMGISSASGTNANRSECDCLPSCTSLTYNAETSQADFNWPMLFQAFRVNSSEMPGVQLARITLFFKEQQFITSERNELYGSTDFLANCGGILGLFTGFSFLSIVEIIYFLSLRVMCNVRKHGRHFWSASEDLIQNDAYIHSK